jgi:hypothetical protein
MATESSTSLLHLNTPAVDHQVHWYPPSAVEQLMGRSAYPMVERDADGNYVLWLDESVSQPRMNLLATDLDAHLAHAAAAGVDVLVLGPATIAEVFHLPAHEAAELLDHVYVEYAPAQHAHPDHVVGLPHCRCRTLLSRRRCSTTRSAGSTCAASRCWRAEWSHKHPSGAVLVCGRLP